MATPRPLSPHQTHKLMNILKERSEVSNRLPSTAESQNQKEAKAKRVAARKARYSAKEKERPSEAAKLPGAEAASVAPPDLPPLPKLTPASSYDSYSTEIASDKSVPILLVPNNKKSNGEYARYVHDLGTRARLAAADAHNLVASSAAVSANEPSGDLFHKDVGDVRKYMAMRKAERGGSLGDDHALRYVYDEKVGHSFFSNHGAHGHEERARQKFKDQMRLQQLRRKHKLNSSRQSSLVSHRSGYPDQYRRDLLPSQNGRATGVWTKLLCHQPPPSPKAGFGEQGMASRDIDGNVAWLNSHFGSVHGRVGSPKSSPVQVTGRQYDEPDAFQCQSAATLDLAYIADTTRIIVQGKESSLSPLLHRDSRVTEALKPIDTVRRSLALRAYRAEFEEHPGVHPTFNSSSAGGESSMSLYSPVRSMSKPPGITQHRINGLRRSFTRDNQGDKRAMMMKAEVGQGWRALLSAGRVRKAVPIERNTLLERHSVSELMSMADKHGMLAAQAETSRLKHHPPSYRGSQRPRVIT